MRVYFAVSPPDYAGINIIRICTIYYLCWYCQGKRQSSFVIFIIKPQITNLGGVFIPVNCMKLLLFRTQPLPRNLLDRDLLVYLFDLYSLAPSVSAETKVDTGCHQVID